MNKSILYSLVIVSLLFFVACEDIDFNDIPTAPSPTEPTNPEDPVDDPTENPVPSDPAPTDPTPTDPEDPTENPPTDPPTNPDPTGPENPPTDPPAPEDPPTNPNPDQPTEPSTPPEQKGSSSALMTGPTIGSGEVSNDQLRKEIGLSLSNPNSNFEFGQAYAVSENIDSQDTAIRWIVSVRNVRDYIICDIKLRRFNYQDAEGNILSTDSNSTIKGANVAEGYRRYSYPIDCLDAGEQGYFADTSTSTTFDSVESIQIESIDTSPYPRVNPNSEFRATPQAYSVRQLADGLQGIDITVKNEGPATVTFLEQSLTFLLDADNKPLYWSFNTRNEDWDGTLEPEQTNFMYDQLTYEGEAKKVLVALDWRGPPPPPE